MGSVLRVAFHQQLAHIDTAVVRLLAMVTDGIAAATDALLDSEPSAVGVLAGREMQVNELRHDLDDLISSTMALQAPVSSELRFLLCALRLVPELERSHDLVHHIALRSSTHLGGQLSPRARGLIAQMSEVTTALWRLTADAYLERDPLAGVQVDERDDVVDELYGLLAAELASGSMPVPVAMEGILVARFYERLADHAVNIARRVATMSGFQAVSPRG